MDSNDTLDLLEEAEDTAYILKVIYRLQAEETYTKEDAANDLFEFLRSRDYL